MPATEYNSAFEFLFNFRINAEQQEFYFRHFCNALTLCATSMDPQFKKFKLNGHVYLWKYRENTRNYPGWNITLDDQAIDSLLTLFGLMNESEFTSEVVI